MAVSAFLVFLIVFIIADPYKANYNHLSSYFVNFILLIASICTVSLVYPLGANVILNAIVIVLLFFCVSDTHRIHNYPHSPLVFAS